MKFDISAIKPGDCLLYKPNGFFGWLIAVKTWNKVSHCEVYNGGGISFASRDGIGVNSYLFRRKQLAYVLRPKTPVNLDAARRWFLADACGQKYDWKGILVFSLAVKQGAKDKMFCSEFLTRFYREGNFHPFSESYDADHIAPAQFLQSPEFDLVWKANK